VGIDYVHLSPRQRKAPQARAQRGLQLPGPEPIARGADQTLEFCLHQWMGEQQAHRRTTALGHPIHRISCYLIC
jgi:hypothetical protein